MKINMTEELEKIFEQIKSDATKNSSELSSYYRDIDEYRILEEDITKSSKDLSDKIDSIIKSHKNLSEEELLFQIVNPFVEEFIKKIIQEYPTMEDRFKDFKLEIINNSNDEHDLTAKPEEHKIIVNMDKLAKGDDLSKKIVKLLGKMPRELFHFIFNMLKDEDKVIEKMYWMYLAKISINSKDNQTTTEHNGYNVLKSSMVGHMLNEGFIELLSSDFCKRNGIHYELNPSNISFTMLCNYIMKKLKIDSKMLIDKDYEDIFNLFSDEVLSKYREVERFEYMHHFDLDFIDGTRRNISNNPKNILVSYNKRNDELNKKYEEFDYSIKYGDIEIPGKMHLFNDGKSLPYMLFVPNDVDLNTNLVVGNFTTACNFNNYNDTINSYIEIVKSGKNIEELLKRLCFELKCPILFPIIPRFKGFYSTFLSSDVYNNIFKYLNEYINNGGANISVDDKDYLTDIHLQVYYMIRNCNRFLGKDEMDKAIMTGYSAAGHFANNFAFLHKDIVSMVIAGGTDGILTLPFKEYKGYKLTSPIGVSDVANFDLDEYSKIKHFVYMGENDTGDCAELDPNNPKKAKHRECFTDEQARIINQLFENCSTQKRLREMVKIYQQLGIEVEMKSYNGNHNDVVLKPDISSQIAEDVCEFVKRNMSKTLK